MFLKFENDAIEVTSFDLTTRRQRKRASDLPVIRIVQISDLQCKQFGGNQAVLIQKIRENRPDLIVITGDLIDAFHYDAMSWRDLCTQLPDIAPIYFVSGNHEWWAGNFQEVSEFLIKNHIHVLQNSSEEVTIRGRSIVIAGIDDPAANNGDARAYKKSVSQLGATIENARYTVLLAHRPEFFKNYDKAGFDLVLSGHAHGGQIRLPILGGLVAPNQGIFPKYTAGLYTGAHTKMIVSRGLGNSIFPQRIFNRPEIVVVDI